MGCQLKLFPQHSQAKLLFKQICGNPCWFYKEALLVRKFSVGYLRQSGGQKKRDAAVSSRRLIVKTLTFSIKEHTPPKTNMEPENGPLEKEIPIGNHHFQVPC